jgi:hypothetical protein
MEGPRNPAGAYAGAYGADPAAPAQPSPDPAVLQAAALAFSQIMAAQGRGFDPTQSAALLGLSYAQVVQQQHQAPPPSNMPNGPAPGPAADQSSDAATNASAPVEEAEREPDSVGDGNADGDGREPSTSQPGPSAKRRKVDGHWKGEQCSMRFKIAALEGCSNIVEASKGRRLEPSEFEAAIEAAFLKVQGELATEVAACEAIEKNSGSSPGDKAKGMFVLQHFCLQP